MEILFSALSFILSIGVIVGTFWSIIGIPPGIIVLIIRLFKKLKITRKILLIFFGGVPLLIIVFVLFFVVNFVATLLGINLPSIQLPQQ